MNKLTFTLLIVLTAFTSACVKIDVPEPVEEAPDFGFWSGKKDELELNENNDSMFLITSISKDALGVRTYEANFKELGSEKTKWKFRFRDSKLREANNSDTSDLFYVSEPRYLKEGTLSSTGSVITHSLINPAQGNKVVWGHSSLGTNPMNGGSNFSIEPSHIAQIMVVTASVSESGRTYSIKKTYIPIKGDLFLKGVQINQHQITFEVENKSPNTKFQLNGNPVQGSETFAINASGEYTLKISDTVRNSYLEAVMYLDLSTGTIKMPPLPFFQSRHDVEYATLPQFSKIEILYYDEDGKEYSTRYVTKHDKPFQIKEIETYEKSNAQGQKVKKLDIEFSAYLKSEDGDSVWMESIRGDIGFSYD